MTEPVQTAVRFGQVYWPSSPAPWNIAGDPESCERQWPILDEATREQPYEIADGVVRLELEVWQNVGRVVWIGATTP